MSTIRIAIHGAAGRMGQRLIALATDDPQLEVAAALEAAGHPRLDDDAGQVAGIDAIGVPLTSSVDIDVDGAIDFSIPEPAVKIAQVCRERSIPLVVATTGFDASQQQQISSVSETTALLQAPNMSLAVNLTMKLAEISAGALKNHPGGVDVEILERHHRYKEDSPSGTALKFGEIIAAVMGQSEHRHGRQGRIGARPASEIGFHAIRVGDNPGEHTIVFGLLGETIELRVAATNRDAYALGALAAVKFLQGKPPGKYTMNDVLGF
jgi:4-hydroxy-tetrahydrodipicolinate reductase